ncbi:MAG TPA: hypothetical protein VFA16_06215 [Mycobacterium sp.]|uniref:hypothetical protein n=1 Tax=Mycobacterium sp. TaxID=1785 RepID=UPI002D260C80|nr:hypothetical protein [Mycobacterium sp.]HZU46838.1 hypothetical protein [Mycobacterium sp.]
MNVFKRAGGEVERGSPGYLFGGHVRTSTVALVLLFLAVWWLHDTYEPTSKQPAQVPATQVVPPGFVPDPNYTWVPRSRLQQPPSTVTVTQTPTMTPTTTPPPTTTTTTSTPAPPPFLLPPPFGPGTTTTTAPPGPSPAPAPPPPGPGPGPAPLPLP